MDEQERHYLTKALAGNEEAFAILVHTYITSLYQFVFLMVCDRDMAEDIVQETWIKAWKHLARFHPEYSFKTWLYTIAKRTAFDVLKKKSSVPFSFFGEEESEFSFEKKVAHSEFLLVFW